MSKVSKMASFEPAEETTAGWSTRSELSIALDFDALDENGDSRLTADQLFDAVDEKNHDGSISRGELQINVFGELLKKHVHSELVVKERETTMRADKAAVKASVATRRLKAAFCLMSILASE